jgi:hypothetical protein
MFVGHSWVRVESSHPPGFAGFGTARRASLDGAGYLPKAPIAFNSDSMRDLPGRSVAHARDPDAL